MASHVLSFSMSRFYGLGVRLEPVFEFPIYRTGRPDSRFSIFPINSEEANLGHCEFTPFNAMESLYCQCFTTRTTSSCVMTEPSTVIFEAVGRLCHTDCFLTTTGRALVKGDMKLGREASCWVEGIVCDEIYGAQWREMMDTLTLITSRRTTKPVHLQSSGTLLRTDEGQYNLRVGWTLQDRLTGVCFLCSVVI